MEPGTGATNDAVILGLTAAHDKACAGPTRCLFSASTQDLAASLAAPDTAVPASAGALPAVWVGAPVRGASPVPADVVGPMRLPVDGDGDGADVGRALTLPESPADSAPLGKPAVSASKGSKRITMDAMTMAIITTTAMINEPLDSCDLPGR